MAQSILKLDPAVFAKVIGKTAAAVVAGVMDPPVAVGDPLVFTKGKGAGLRRFVRGVFNLNPPASGIVSGPGSRPFKLGPAKVLWILQHSDADVKALWATIKTLEGMPCSVRCAVTPERAAFVRQHAKVIIALLPEMEERLKVRATELKAEVAKEELEEE